jgi:hypothetical protein
MPFNNYLPTPSVFVREPFKIKKIVGEDIPDNSYYVESGVCFSSFSFDTGTFVPIKGLGSGSRYQLTDNKKLYIDIDILPNLQVSGAQIKCEKTNTPDIWTNYPNMIEIKPSDEVDKDGRVTKIIDNKKQTKCYVLIGYDRNDTLKNGGKEGEAQDPSVPVQILNTDFILLASVVSGVPVVFPCPYFNGQGHVNSINNKK